MTTSRQSLVLLKRAFPHGPASLHQNAPPPPPPAAPPPPPEPDPMVGEMQHQLEQTGQELQKLQEQSQQQQAELEHQKLQAEAAKAEAGLSKREAQLTKQEAQLQKQMLDQQQEALDLKSEAQPHFSPSAQEQLKNVHKRLQSLLNKSASTYEPPAYQGNQKWDQRIISAGKAYDNWLEDDRLTRNPLTWVSALVRPSVRAYQGAADVVADKGWGGALTSGDYWKHQGVGALNIGLLVGSGGVGKGLGAVGRGVNTVASKIPGIGRALSTTPAMNALPIVGKLGTGPASNWAARWGGRAARFGAGAAAWEAVPETQGLQAGERRYQQAEREMQQRDRLAQQYTAEQDRKIESDMLGSGPSLQAQNYWGAYAGAPYGQPSYMRGTLDAYHSQRLANPNTWAGQFVNIGMPFLSQWLTGGFQPTYGQG